MSFEVVEINCHNQKDVARKVAAMKFKFGFVSESQHVGPELSAGRRLLTGPATKGRNMTQDVGILVKPKAPDLGYGYFRVSEEYKPLKRVAPDRYGHVAVTTVKGVEVALIALHPVAGAKTIGDPKNTHHPLVQRYRLARNWLFDTIHHQFYLHREVIFGGDVQLGQHVAVDWSIHSLFRHWNFGLYADGIDLIAWSPGIKQVGAGSAVDVGSDHPLLRVRLDIIKNTTNNKGE